MISDLSKSIIFPTKLSLFRCRVLSSLLMTLITTPLIFHYTTLSIIIRLSIGLVMIYISSIIVGMIMLAFSKHFLATLKERVEAKEVLTSVTVLPLNSLQLLQSRLLGASSRFATDTQGKRYRVVYKDHDLDSFSASLYCLKEIGPFKLYTVVVDE